MDWAEREESTGRHFLWWQQYSEGVCVCEAMEDSRHQCILSFPVPRGWPWVAVTVLGVASQSCKQPYTFEGL